MFLSKRKIGAKKVRVASFFAGCGGLDFGFKNAGFALDTANEIEMNYAESYFKLTNHKANVEDFWNLVNENFESDIIIGGPPCQSFSLVGKRLSDDPRGKLVKGYLDLILQNRPKAFVIENVPGLAASNFENKKMPVFLKEEFDKAGYSTLVAKIDATEYFVPQKRKRIFIIGILNPTAEIRLITRDDFRLHIQKRSGILLNDEITSSKSALHDLGALVRKGEISKYRKTKPTRYAELMRQSNTDGVTLHNPPTMSALDSEFIKFIPPGGNYLDIPDAISTKRILNFKQTGGRTTTYGRLHPDNPSYTVNTYFNRPNVGSNYHYEEQRLISVREALRLQSFPDFLPTVPDLFAFSTQLQVLTLSIMPPREAV